MGNRPQFLVLASSLVLIFCMCMSATCGRVLRHHEDDSQNVTTDGWGSFGWAPWIRWPPFPWWRPIYPPTLPPPPPTHHRGHQPSSPPVNHEPAPPDEHHRHSSPPPTHHHHDHHHHHPSHPPPPVNPVPSLPPENPIPSPPPENPIPSPPPENPVPSPPPENPIPPSPVNPIPPPSSPPRRRPVPPLPPRPQPPASHRQHPPPPSPGSSGGDHGKGDPRDCSTALIYVEGCVSDLIKSFFAKHVWVGAECCKAISGLSESCFDQAFTQFSDPVFQGRVRRFCTPT